MKKIREYKPKKHYHILLNGRGVGESWAVSPQKAINNYWWRVVKGEDPYSVRNYEPSDFDAVEI